MIFCSEICQISSPAFLLRHQLRDTVVNNWNIRDKAVKERHIQKAFIESYWSTVSVIRFAIGTSGIKQIKFHPITVIVNA